MDNRFIQQSINIRKEYFKTINSITSLEEELNIIKNDIDNIDIDNVVDKNGIMKTISEFEINIKKIEKLLEPHNKKIKELEKEADVLFENIKTRYPNMSNIDIKKFLIPYIKDIK